MVAGGAKPTAKPTAVFLSRFMATAYHSACLHERSMQREGVARRSIVGQAAAVLVDELVHAAPALTLKTHEPCIQHAGGWCGATCYSRPGRRHSIG